MARELVRSFTARRQVEGTISPTRRARGRPTTEFRIRFTCVQNAGTTNVNRLNMDELREVGLGIPPHESRNGNRRGWSRIMLSWTREQLDTFIVNLFPVLRSVEFQLHQARRGGRLVPLPAEVRSAQALKNHLVQHSRTALSNPPVVYVVPNEDIVHMPMGTPTVLARIDAAAPSQPEINVSDGDTQPPATDYPNPRPLVEGDEHQQRNPAFEVVEDSRVEEAREIRAQQDRAYEESLRTDRERAQRQRETEEQERLRIEDAQQVEMMRQRLEQEREEMYQELRDARRAGVPEQPVNGFGIRVRLPDGNTLVRRFLPDMDVSTLICFIGSQDCSKANFRIRIPGRREAVTSDMMGVTLTEIGLSTPTSVDIAWMSDDEEELDQTGRLYMSGSDISVQDDVETVNFPDADSVETDTNDPVTPQETVRPADTAVISEAQSSEDQRQETRLDQVATPFEDDDDFQLPAAPNRNHEELETTNRTPTTSGAPQQDSLFRRHLEAGLGAAQAFASGARVDSLQDELLRALPQLNRSRPPRTPRAGPARPRRQSQLQRAASDWRRNQCVRVRFTALDSPSYRGSLSVNLIALREKGLGREDDRTELLPIAWGPQEIENHIRMKFPSLGETEFDVLIGSRGGRLTEVQELTGMALKGLVKSHNFARLWIRPKEELRHVTMGTPTVLATARVEVVPPVERLDADAQLPLLESVSNTSEMLQIPPTSSAPPVPGTSRQPDQPQTSAGTISPQPSTSSLPDLPQSVDPFISVLSDLQPEPVDIPSSPATSTPLSSTPSTPRLVLDVTDEDVEDRLRALRQTQTEAAETVTIRRARIVEDVIEVYKNLDLTVRLRVQFAGERGQDLGGLTKDMFSCFWGKAFESYFKGENARVPHLSHSDRHKARDVFPILGKIMEHMLRLLGYLPNMMCRSCLIMMASADCEVDEDLLLEDYLLYLPESEGDLLKQCLNSTSWSDAQNRRLLLFNNAHHMTAIATPANLKQTLLNAAQIELLDTSSAFCRLMFSGLSNAGKNFFRNLSIDSIRMLYSVSQATPEKVACLIERVFEEEDLTAMQVVIINYLSALVRGFDSDMLQKFLIWVTGSPSMPNELNISFNSSYGLRRAPVARTCGNLLELSEEYDTYQEFKRELVNVISSDEAMEMTIM